MCIDGINCSMPNSQVEDVVELLRTPFDKGRRSANYTVCEDETSVMAWENVTLDAVMGNNQTGANCWKDIMEENHRNAKMPSYQDEVFRFMLCIWMLYIY